MKINDRDTREFREDVYEFVDYDFSAETAANDVIRELKGKTKKLARLILEGHTIQDAGNILGIPESTARRMLRTAGTTISAKRSGGKANSCAIKGRGTRSH